MNKLRKVKITVCTATGPRLYTLVLACVHELAYWKFSDVKVSLATAVILDARN